jgi:hypothetical protein
MDGLEPQVYQTTVTDGEGATWAVRHYAGVSTASNSMEETSYVEFAEGDRRYVARMPGSGPGTQEEYLLALEDARRNNRTSGRGFD